MNVLSKSVALAQPLSPEDFELSIRGLEQARRGALDVEVRIGMGPLVGKAPARVLAYAACVADVLASDLNLLVGSPNRIVLFSSAAKVEGRTGASALTTLATLGGALRLAGVRSPITLDSAASSQEIPKELQAPLPDNLFEWMRQRADNHGGAIAYAYEHAAASMFADVTNEPNPPFRVTIGGATEARFWALRMRVRAAAVALGHRVAPAAGLILRALRVPWYYPLETEPPLSAMASPATAIAALDRAANPKHGGNAGLSREARVLRRFRNEQRLAEMISLFEAADLPLKASRDFALQIGPILQESMETEHG